MYYILSVLMRKGRLAVIISGEHETFVKYPVSGWYRIRNLLLTLLLFKSFHIKCAESQKSYWGETYKNTSIRECNLQTIFRWNKTPSWMHLILIANITKW